MRRQKTGKPNPPRAEQDLPQAQVRSGGWKQRVFFAVVCLFVAAGTAGATYLLCVMLPKQNAVQAAVKYAPVLSAADVGDVVLMGTYEQDDDPGNGVEPIEWLVLGRQQDRLLLLSRYALDCVPFNTYGVMGAWDASTILPWLNEQFLDAAFSGPEKSLIQVTKVMPDRNVLFATDPGDVTRSRVFLMSIAEVEAYFPVTEDRLCSPTPYAVSRGVRTQGDGSCEWWLRTPGYDGNAASRVLNNGSIGFTGQPTNRKLAVRPAIWVACAQA